MERKLASIQRVIALDPIEGADRIEVATIQGWKVVCQKGLYEVNDLACYFEVDSFIPTTVAPFLTKPDHSPKVFNEVQGERLKTAKLRGQISQGLLLPIWEESIKDKVHGLEEGTDVTELLEIQKWEAPIPAQLAGQVKGMFPIFIRKTDQERCISGDTVVLTRGGDKAIKELVDKQSFEDVLSMTPTGDLEWQPITGHSSVRNNKDWLRITLEDGSHIDITPKHRVYLPGLRCYRLGSELKVGDILLKNGISKSVLEDNTDELPNLLTEY